MYVTSLTLLQSLVRNPPPTVSARGECFLIFEEAFVPFKFDNCQVGEAAYEGSKRSPADLRGNEASRAKEWSSEKACFQE